MSLFDQNDSIKIKYKSNIKISWNTS